MIRGPTLIIKPKKKKKSHEKTIGKFKSQTTDANKGLNGRNIEVCVVNCWLQEGLIGYQNQLQLISRLAHIYSCIHKWSELWSRRLQIFFKRLQLLKLGNEEKKKKEAQER